MANGLKVLLKNANVINAKVLLPKVDFSEDTIEPSHVLAGDTYHDENGKNIGTMPINESEAVVFSSASDTYRIAEGYHDGTGSVSIKRQDGLIPEKILEDTTILGVKGNIPIRSAENVSFQTLNDTYTISRGYYNNGGTIRIAPNPQLVPSNLLEGVSVLGVEGSIPINTSTTTIIDTADARFSIPQGYHDGNGVVQIAHFADLVPENMLEGKTILGVQGSIPVITPENVTFDSADDEYVIPRGYHDGTERVSIENNPDLLPENIKAEVTILGVTGTLSTLPDGDEMLFGDPTDNTVGIG